MPGREIRGELRQRLTDTALQTNRARDEAWNLLLGGLPEHGCEAALRRMEQLAWDLQASCVSLIDEMYLWMDRARELDLEAQRLSNERLAAEDRRLRLVEGGQDDREAAA